MSRRLASRPSLDGEWASELDTRWYPSRAESRQFMGGSEDSPVSRAWMWGVRSPKQSPMASKPEKAPKREKWGVQIWAGIKTAWGLASRVISSRSRQSRPRMGRPSEWMLPMASSRRDRFSAAAREGRRIRLCTLRTLPSFL